MMEIRARLVLAAASVAVLLSFGSGAAAPLQVVSISPARLGRPPRPTAAPTTFDRAVDHSSITSASFRVFGKQSGTATGPFTFSPDNTAVTLTPSRPFAAGEVVHVNLSHDVTAADASPLRSAGYTYQFRIGAAIAPPDSTPTQPLINRNNPSVNTPLYGAMAGDLNGDGFVALPTVNEDSAALRVTLNRADGRGTFGAFLAPPQHIGVESS